MTIERFRLVRNVYEAALEVQDPAGRKAFLTHACKGDAELGSEVEKLLVANECASDFMDGPLLGTVDANSGSTTMKRMEGRHAGEYLLLREIGHGGMGTVYLATRENDVVHKQVAVKIVRAGLADADVLRRFLQERDILAGLDHPGIARLIDGGSTEEGLPYFVMDYVEGERIDSWCDRRKLNVTERLKLFQSVCESVHYAHQHLVVHRDLKPANIMVTADGHVKLLDFGIAKVLDPGGASGNALQTETLMRRMTLDYASPEQVRGESVHTTSDIYALGIVLYELLTGHRPYKMRSHILHEIARVICEEEPIPPSIAVFDGDARSVSETREGDSVHLKRRLEGDLDTILLKALQKGPSRRYSSADQFSEDVSRHLAGLPVSAQKDTLWYRASKFIGRHQVGLVATALVVMACALGLATTLWQTHLALEAIALTHAPSIPVLAPELMEFTVLLWMGFGAAVYFSRAPLRRTLGALAAGCAFMIIFLGEETLPASMGLRHFTWTIAQRPASIFYTSIIPYGAMIALLGWRLTRRFGWRGQIALLLAATIGGPFRDYAATLWIPGIAPVAGVLPWIAGSLMWLSGVGSGQLIMRLIAGPAGSDRLARLAWKR